MRRTSAGAPTALPRVPARRPRTGRPLPSRRPQEACRRRQAAPSWLPFAPVAGEEASGQMPKRGPAAVLRVARAAPEATPPRHRVRMSRRKRPMRKPQEGGGGACARSRSSCSSAKRWASVQMAAQGPTPSPRTALPLSAGSPRFGASFSRHRLAGTSRAETKRYCRPPAGKRSSVSRIRMRSRPWRRTTSRSPSAGRGRSKCLAARERGGRS